MQLFPSDFQQPFYSDLSAQGTAMQPKVIPLLAVIWQYKDRAADPKYSVDKKAVYDMLFGGTDSVADWVSQNSLRRLQIVPVSTDLDQAVIGPVSSTFSQDYYTGGKDKATGRTAKGDGFDQNSYEASYPDAVRAAAAAGLNIAGLDRNHDNVIDQSELIILIIKKQDPGKGCEGYTRNLAQKQTPFEYLVVNGKTFSRPVSEHYTDLPNNFSSNLEVAVEELMHQCIGIVDKYPDGKRQGNDPALPGQFSLTCPYRKPVHLDAYDKLKLGWLNPLVVEQAGVYKIRQTNLTGDALILYNTRIGLSEFFIVENRTRGTSYDKYRDAALGDGLAIWHCIQDKNLDDWPRFATNLRRAQPGLFRDTGNDPFPLFSGDSPNTAYLLNDSSTPQNLRFRNNVSSGITIRNVSRSGFEMSLEIDPGPRGIWRPHFPLQQPEPVVPGVIPPPSAQIQRT